MLTSDSRQDSYFKEIVLERKKISMLRRHYIHFDNLFAPISFGCGGGGGGYSPKSYKNRYTKEAAATGLPGQHNGEQDAYRHCITSGNLARRITETTAVWVGDLYEWSGDGPAEEKRMDKHNNRIGVSIGSNANSRDDVSSGCREKLNDGRPVTLQSQR